MKDLKVSGLNVEGDARINGKLQSVNGVEISQDDVGSLIEKRYGNSLDNRFGIGEYRDGNLRLYAGQKTNTGSINLSLAKKDGTFDDIIKVKTNKSVDVHGEMNVPSMDVENNIKINGDIVFNGDNSWSLSTPDDGKKTMYIAPGPPSNWDWNRKVTLETNGYVSTLGGGLNIRGGVSEHNPNSMSTHFPFASDNKNYIRGDTEIRGNTNNIGDLTVGRKLQSAQDLNVLNANPGPLVEKRYGNNLGDRYGIGQDADGGTRLYAANEFGPATVNLSLAKEDGTFDDIVTVKNDRSTNVAGPLAVNHKQIMDGSTIYNKGRQHIHGEENLYLLNKGGVTVSRTWGGNGNMTVEGTNRIEGVLSLGGATPVSVDAPCVGGCRFVVDTKGNVGIGNPKAKLDVNGDLLTTNAKIGGQLCIGDICLQRNELAKLKALANAK